MRIPLTVVRVLAVISLALSSLSTLNAAEKLSLSSLFTDHTVLQRNIAVPVWGKAEVGSEVTSRRVWFQRIAPSCWNFNLSLDCERGRWHAGDTRSW